jgi:hypothetical protein
VTQKSLITFGQDNRHHNTTIIGFFLALIFLFQTASFPEMAVIEP